MMVNVSPRYSQPIAPRLKGRKEEGKHGEKICKKVTYLTRLVEVCLPLEHLKRPKLSLSVHQK